MSTCYEVNVSKRAKPTSGRYEHYFSIRPESIPTEGKLHGIMSHLEEAFPVPEFKIDVYEHTHTREPYSPDVVPNPIPKLPFGRTHLRRTR